MSAEVESPFSRSEALLGSLAVARLRAATVAIFGVGGVGGWCAEALVRTGIGRLVIIDDDVVKPSNLNRQAAAVAATMGERKVEALKARLLAINPEAKVVARYERFRTLADFSGGFDGFDVIVDAIDSVDCKAELLLGADAKGLAVFSSMGAAYRVDPTRVTVSRFKRVEGDALARALRQRFKRLGCFPKGEITAVYSTEPPRECVERGSLMPVTAAFGMALATEVIRYFCDLQGRS